MWVGMRSEAASAAKICPAASTIVLNTLGTSVLELIAKYQSYCNSSNTPTFQLQSSSRSVLLPAFLTNVVDQLFHARFGTLPVNAAPESPELQVGFSYTLRSLAE